MNICTCVASGIVKNCKIRARVRASLEKCIMHDEGEFVGNSSRYSGQSFKAGRGSR